MSLGGLIADLVRDAYQGIKARIAKRRRTASDVLDAHGPLRATAAKQRAHEAARRRGELKR